MEQDVGLSSIRAYAKGHRCHVIGKEGELVGHFSAAPALDATHATLRTHITTSSGTTPHVRPGKIREQKIIDQFVCKKKEASSAPKRIWPKPSITLSLSEILGIISFHMQIEETEFKKSKYEV